MKKIKCYNCKMLNTPNKSARIGKGKFFDCGWCEWFNWVISGEDTGKPRRYFTDSEGKEFITKK